MDFKSQVSLDIANVFLNPDEFADTHTIDGTPVVCVVDDARLEPNSTPGVYVSEFRIHLPKSAIPAVPPVGAILNVDGDRVWATHVSDDVGMLTIHCTRSDG